MRYRRYADPQGSITLEGMKPLSGPDQRPSVNLDYNHRLLNNDRTHMDAYGKNYFKVETNFKKLFL